jgi:hypothetical protein
MELKVEMSQFLGKSFESILRKKITSKEVLAGPDWPRTSGAKIFFLNEISKYLISILVWKNNMF